MSFKRTTAALKRDDGIVMILALSVMAVTALLLIAAYTATNGDIETSRRDTVQQQAYYAALAGVQEFEYHLETNPDYWEGCPKIASELPNEAGAHYSVEILPAESAPNKPKACEAANAFKTAIEADEPSPNTFRILSTGCAGTGPQSTCPAATESTKRIESNTKEKISVRQIVATFRVTGFLNFVYYTNHEDVDPELYSAPANCALPNEYYPNTANCSRITFASSDKVNGPMHTNDAVCMDKGATFGREKETPADTVEFYGGLYNKTECEGQGVYNTKTKGYIKGEFLQPPESDSTLEAYALPVDEFEGVTRLKLEGETIKVTNKGVTTPLPWPENGLLWVKASKNTNGKEPCTYAFVANESDESKEESGEKGCGTVYVEGKYTKSLTVASADDVVVDGNLLPEGVTAGSTPTGSATLGLIAENYVRVYHPVEGGWSCQNSSSFEMKSPWIYAAILTTKHSFVVDNYSCGNPMGNLNVYGAIAQNYRGIVAEGNSSGIVHGYVKNYNYDNRLAVDEPPYFLAPLKAGWKVVRETAP